MKRAGLCLTCLLFLSATLWADLRAGAAQVKITPEPGTPMAGYYHTRESDGVLDDLYARALVLENDGVKVALVTLDLISTVRWFVEEARQKIEAATGIPGGHVMIAATHAHTGPILAKTSSRYDELGGQHPKAVAYTEQLPARIAEAVQTAHSRLAPARASGAIGSCEVAAYNRRFHMRGGGIGWNPGIKNPDIVKAAGPIDPSLPFVHLESADRKPIATFVNYAVHLDNVGGARVSADIPFAVSECLSWWRGPDHVTLYASGACGDVNQLNVFWDQRQQSPEASRRLGVMLAGEALRQWPNLKTVENPMLQVRSEMVSLPLAPITATDVEKAMAAKKRGLSDTSRANFMEAVQTYKVLDVDDRKGKPYEVEAQVITLGSALAWVSLPGEIFVQLGLDLKLDSPFPQTMIAELANGSIGYIPNRRAYPQGEYEVVSARCAEGSGEMLVQAAVRMLKEMHDKAR